MEERKYPGDPGYKGGTTITTVIINGKAKRVKTIRDAYGNIVYGSETDKIFGIF